MYASKRFFLLLLLSFKVSHRNFGVRWLHSLWRTKIMITILLKNILLNRKYCSLLLYKSVRLSHHHWVLSFTYYSLLLLFLLLLLLVLCFAFYEQLSLFLALYFHSFSVIPAGAAIFLDSIQCCFFMNLINNQ